MAITGVQTVRRDVYHGNRLINPGTFDEFNESDGKFYIDLTFQHVLPRLLLPNEDALVRFSLRSEHDHAAYVIAANAFALPVQLMNLITGTDHVCLHFDQAYPRSSAVNIDVDRIVCRLTHGAFAAQSGALGMKLRFGSTYILAVEFITPEPSKGDE